MSAGVNMKKITRQTITIRKSELVIVKTDGAKSRVCPVCSFPIIDHPKSPATLPENMTDDLPVIEGEIVDIKET
jgi:hypothetical protein